MDGKGIVATTRPNKVKIYIYIYIICNFPIIDHSFYKVGYLSFGVLEFVYFYLLI